TQPVLRGVEEPRVKGIRLRNALGVLFRTRDGWNDAVVFVGHAAVQRMIFVTHAIGRALVNLLEESPGDHLCGFTADRVEIACLAAEDLVERSCRDEHLSEVR